MKKNNVFGPCFGKVNTYLYFQNCLWDYCTSLVNSLPTEPALCNAFEAMSRECALNSSILNWRSPSRCRNKSLSDYLYEYQNKLFEFFIKPKVAILVKYTLNVHQVVR